jgi:hypothetical protein
MLKRLFSLMLTALLINVAASAVSARSKDDEQARRIEKIRDNVRKLGIGKEARLELKLHDGTKLKGYIIEATDSSFIVVDEKGTTTVIYSQVAQLKGKNRLTAAKVGIAAAKGVGIVAAVAGACLLFAYIFVGRS